MAKNLEKRLKQTILPLLGAGIIYISGFMTYAIKNDAMFYPDEYIQLNKRKTELVGKIDGWEKFIPLMKEPFALQYKDSLQNAREETGKIEIKMTEIRLQHDKMADKTKYSWAGFLIN